jgi:hypothetical protein
MAKLGGEEERADRKIINAAKAAARRKAEEMEKDTFSYIWFIFIVAIVVMTVGFKGYMKEMINVSILFIIFWYLQPLTFGMTGRTVTTVLSKGQDVPIWKRFPLFFLVIVILYLINRGIQLALDMAFPDEHVNVVFVIVWLGFLYFVWVYVFSKFHKEGK